MWQQILAKPFCKHVWKETYIRDVWDEDDHLVATKVTLVCQDCGAIKRIKL